MYVELKFKSMKKLVFLVLLAIISLGASAQTKGGESSVGFTIGGGFDHVDNATLGIDYRYCIFDNFRINPGLTYHVKNEGLSSWAIDLNANYVFSLNDWFGFYPLAGLDLSFWKISGDHASANFTRFGANIGLGAEFYATDNLTIGAEFKYLGVKDFDRPMLGFRIGYNF